MESDIHTITAVAAVALAIALALVTVQIAIWQALRASPSDAVADAPTFLASGRGILATALVAAAATATIALLVL